MDQPKWSKDLPEKTELKAGDQLMLVVAADPPPSSSDAHLKYEWSHSGQVVGQDKASYELATPSKEDAGEYKVTCRAVSTDGATESDPIETTTTVSLDAAPQANDVPLAWDPRFANQALWVAGILMGILLLVLLLLRATNSSLVASIAFGLLVLAAGLIAGGVLIALMELRGRARVLEGGRGVLGDLVAKSSDIIKAFGELRLGSAILLLAAVAMICATVLAWHSLPGSGTAASPSPSPSPSASLSSSPSMSPSPSASVPPSQ